MHMPSIVLEQYHRQKTPDDSAGRSAPPPHRGRRSPTPLVVVTRPTTIMAAAAAAVVSRSLHLFFVLLAVSVSGVCSTKSFTITNNCGYTVWPGIQSGATSPPLDTTGFELPPGASRTLAAPPGWSGRLWGRTLCSTTTTTTDPNTFTCATGDCGSGAVPCGGANAAPPVTLAELTLDGGSDKTTDFYDVSLVDGFNLPMLVAPSSGSAGAGGNNCAATGCLVDLNAGCPADLRVVVGGEGGGGVVACKSACLAYGSPEYCCSGEHGSPGTCGPSAYSEYFKNACPRAYSYAYDDATSTFTCAAGGGGDTEYTVTFCPDTNSVKSSGAPGDLPLTNGTTMAYAGDQQVGAAAVDMPPFVVVVATALVAMLAGGALL